MMLSWCVLGPYDHESLSPSANVVKQTAVGVITASLRAENVPQTHALSIMRVCRRGVFGETQSCSNSCNETADSVASFHINRMQRSYYTKSVYADICITDIHPAVHVRRAGNEPRAWTNSDQASIGRKGDNITYISTLYGAESVATVLWSALQSTAVDESVQHVWHSTKARCHQLQLPKK